MASNSKISGLVSLPVRRTGIVAAMMALVTGWRLRARERRALGQLDDHMLFDIGVDPVTARQEAARPFWEE